MSIQRIWANEIASGYELGDPQINPEYVLYVDHVAVTEEWSKIAQDNFDAGVRAERARWTAVTEEPDSHALGVYRAGIADERARIRQALLALHVKFTDSSGDERCNYCWLDEYGDLALPWPCPTVAAIDAPGGEP